MCFFCPIFSTVQIDYKKTPQILGFQKYTPPKKIHKRPKIPKIFQQPKNPKIPKYKSALKIQFSS